MEPQSDTVMPLSRLAHSQASVGDCIYIFGGRVGIDMNETSMNDLWKFHVPTETWTHIDTKQPEEEVPEARSFHKMIAVGTSLYLLGGCGASGRLRDLYRYDTVENKWYKLGESTLLKGRGGPNLLFLRDANNDPYLAVVAGFIGEETKDGHVFHLKSAAWADSTMDGLTNLRPRSVCVFGSFYSANVGVIFGGEVNPSDRGQEGAGGFTNDVILLDGVNGKIINSVRAPSDDKNDNLNWPERRGWSHGATYESEDGKVNRLFVYGGLAGTDENPKRLDDLWVCDLV